MVAQKPVDIEELLEDFEFLDDWEQRFTYLIDLGKKLPPMDEADMVEDNRVHGCQSTVYMVDRVRGNGQPVVEFSAQSDAHIVNGLIAILLALYSGETPQKILETDPKQVFTKMGLEEHLSPTRRNGLHAMVQRIQELAGRHC